MKEEKERIELNVQPFFEDEEEQEEQIERQTDGERKEERRRLKRKEQQQQQQQQQYVGVKKDGYIREAEKGTRNWQAREKLSKVSTCPDSKESPVPGHRLAAAADVSWTKKDHVEVEGKEGEREEEEVGGGERGGGGGGDGQAGIYEGKEGAGSSEESMRVYAWLL
ncbi:hypothetical protein M0804_007906 [Polistes exclamans]|nr:hypothetical protein M0804_007906 [Polistes exclamans]